MAVFRFDLGFNIFWAESSYHQAGRCLFFILQLSDHRIYLFSNPLESISIQQRDLIQMLRTGLVNGFILVSFAPPP
jgi:hypothetical protein